MGAKRHLAGGQLCDRARGVAEREFDVSVKTHHFALCYRWFTRAVPPPAVRSFKTPLSCRGRAAKCVLCCYGASEGLESEFATSQIGSLRRMQKKVLFYAYDDTNNLGVFSFIFSQVVASFHGLRLRCRARPKQNLYSSTSS